MDPFNLILALFVVLGLAAEHYFPYWIDLTGRKLPDPVRLIVNYAAGSLVWFGAFTAWLVKNGHARIALVGWSFALLAGLTVVLLYAHDRRVADRRAAQDRGERLDLIERRKNAPEKRS
jgi:hypothetical protein